MVTRVSLILLLIHLCIVATKVPAQDRAVPDSRMCQSGELLFAEDFNPETVSDRWGFKANFALRDGALLRTQIPPDESQRVFLKDTTFHNAIIQFDFKFAGQTTDLRLVTGSGGGYNSVTQIFRDAFQINTPVDRKAGIVPAHLGECSRSSDSTQWQTMTVEYWNDEILAHVNEDEIVIGRHPIIDRNRQYFAFQFDLPGASIDNVRIWKAVEQHLHWPETRRMIAARQSERAPVRRSPVDRYQWVYTNVKSRLTLHDPTYRDLVTRHEKLQTALHEDYPEAFATHKNLSKQIAMRKKHLKESDAEFKRMETDVHRAARAEDDYVLSRQPELAELKKDGVPRQRFLSELGQVRARLEAVQDSKLAALVAETARRQAALESQFPSAFESVDAAVAKRQEVRRALNDDPQFQVRNRAVVEAGRAVKDYEQHAAPELTELARQAKAFADSSDAP